MDRIRLDFKQNEKKKKRKERKIVKSSTFFPATEKELGELENTRAEKNSPSQHIFAKLQIRSTSPFHSLKFVFKPIQRPEFLIRPNNSTRCKKKQRKRKRKRKAKRQEKRGGKRKRRRRSFESGSKINRALAKSKQTNCNVLAHNNKLTHASLGPWIHSTDNSRCNFVILLNNVIAVSVSTCAPILCSLFRSIYENILGVRWQVRVLRIGETVENRYP